VIRTGAAYFKLGIKVQRFPGGTLREVKRRPFQAGAKELDGAREATRKVGADSG
jgi:hypothetical protein